MDSTNGFAMAGGDGINSYRKNSSYQRAAIDASKSLVQKSIAEYINPIKLVSFRIADLGCSVGPNTFTVVDNILESVKLKYQDKRETPEFQVYFNDHVLNDFNTLFKSLPSNGEYYASGVPGSFYTRLFPRASIHVAHCSYSLHWLSEVPREITNPNCPAYNKGKIHYAGAREETINAYGRQHATNFSKFLQVRAQEIVPGGLVLLVLPARPNGVPHSQLLMNIMFETLGACLMDLVRKGVIEEEKVDSFNLPAYFSSQEELENVIKQNGDFSIERVESLPEIIASTKFPPQVVSLIIRAVVEDQIRKQFGDDILDQLFELLLQKLYAMDRAVSPTALNLFMLLKRHQDSTAFN